MKKYIIAVSILLSLDATAQKINDDKKVQGVFKTAVPVEAYNIILSRPTDKSITVSVLTKDTAEGFIVYGIDSNQLTQRTTLFRFTAAKANHIPIEGLKADTRYYYRFHYHNSFEKI